MTGSKNWSSGDVLNAADVNSILADQVVMVFANSTARDAGFGGAGEPTLADGMACYLTGTNQLQTYNGSSWDTHANDYEEGTWTAGLEFGGTGVTTAQTAARYTKIGRAVTVTFTGVSPASIGSGNMRITGLPFTPQGTNWPGYGPVQMSPASMATGESAIQLYCVGATTKLDILVQSPSAHAFITDGDVGTGTNMYGSITYFV